MTRKFFVWHESIWTSYRIWSLCIRLMRWKRWRIKALKDVMKFSNQHFRNQQKMKQNYHFPPRSSNITRIWGDQMETRNNDHTIHHLRSTIVAIDDRFSSFFWMQRFWMHTSCEIYFILIQRWLIWNFNVRSLRDCLHLLNRLDKSHSSYRWRLSVWKTNHLLANESTWASCSIACPAKYNWPSLASARHSTKSAQTTSKDDVNRRSDDAAKTVILVARRKNVEMLCTRSFNI